MRGNAVATDLAGHPENLLLKVSFEVGPSIVGNGAASLAEIRSKLVKELENVSQDRFLQLALTFIVDEIDYTLGRPGGTAVRFPRVVSASWDCSAPDASTRIYYPPFDEATEIAL